MVVWAVAASVLGAALLIRHVVALPTPTAGDAVLRAALAEADAGRWRAVHFMYRACPCSRRVIDHLVTSPRVPGVRERVVIVDELGAEGAEDARLRSAGFRVEVIRPEELYRRFHVEAAPVMVVAEPEGGIAYVGGYNRRKQSPAYEDRAIIEDAIANHRAPALPVFGCPVSARLARMLDPLRLGSRR